MSCMCVMKSSINSSVLEHSNCCAHYSVLAAVLIKTALFLLNTLGCYSHCFFRCPIPRHPWWCHSNAWWSCAQLWFAALIQRFLQPPSSLLIRTQTHPHKMHSGDPDVSGVLCEFADGAVKRRSPQSHLCRTGGHEALGKRPVGVARCAGCAVDPVT